MYNADNYGYYIYKGFKTYSKYEIMCRTEDIQTVKWIYNDEYFSSFDWKKEPNESLESLYLKRAIKLREKYDYIILMYSGGSDSGNILDTFVNNDIILDEVAHIVNYEGSKDKGSFQNKEIYEVAKPKVDQLIQQKNLKTVSRLIDITKRTVDFFNQKNKFDFIYFSHSFGAPNMHAKCKLYQEVKEWRDLVSSGKKVCFLWGSDKPRVSGHDGVFNFYFTDVIDGSISVGDQLRGNDGPADELFYWAPEYESTMIMIKQAHIIKNFLSYYNIKKKLYDFKYLPNEEVTCHCFEKGKLQYMLGGNLLKKLIYPTWNPVDEVMLKSKTGNFLSSRDEWFWKDVSNPTVNTFLSGVEHIAENVYGDWIDAYFKYNNKVFPKKIKKVKSKLYEL